jgi:acyl transferase domain-containing protein
MTDLSKRIASLSPEQRAALAGRLRGTATPNVPEPIAIVGMACRVPGADNADEYWQLLLDRRDAVTEVPAERWPANTLFDADDATPGGITSKWGGFLRNVDRFDAAFFGISPREAQQMDPQQRLLLEVAWEALEDAGQDVDKLAGTRTGVFVGLHSYGSDYLWLQLNRPDKFDPFTGTGNAHNIAAGRLSYLWDLRGPAVVVDTACSSSLVAVHLACQSLRAGESDVALTGGVNLILTPLFTVAVSRMHMFSPDGRCKPFDSRADGFVRSEGCGMVVLKRLSDAIKNGDRILSVIRGTAINQDGRTNGITAPSSHSQQSVIIDALQNARVEADSIGYVEAHGTGTPLGDPIEAEALGAIFKSRPDGRRCALGSAKANLGHLEGAAGIAGLIKAVLALRHATIPAMAHFKTLSSHLSFDGTALEVPAAAQAWPAAETPRRAGVSSFGWSGTNAHVILEEAPAQDASAPAPAPAMYVLPISARNEEALASLASAYENGLVTGRLQHDALQDICLAAGLDRTAHDYRGAACGATREELVDALRALAGGERRWDVPTRRAVAKRPHLAFVFCGQGPQAAAMGIELLNVAPAYTETLTRIDGLVRDLAGWSVIDELRTSEGQSRLDQTEFAQPALFALQAALAAEWASRGIVPGAVIGHSVGEIAAAQAAGVLTLEDATRIVVHRARLMQRATGYGRMVAAALGARDAEAIAAASGGKLSVAAINAPNSSVLSGDTTAIMQLVQTLDQRGVAARPLPVNYAFHSRQMDPILAEFRAAIRSITPQDARIPIASTVAGQVAKGSAFDAEYWAQNVRQTVRFTAAIAAVSRSAGNVFLEIGPHPVLASAIADSSRQVSDDSVVVGSLHRGRSDVRSIAAAHGSLFTAGCDIDWRAIYPGPRTRPSLPSYPWQRQRYWIAASSETNGRTAPDSRVFPGTRVRSPLFDNIVFETRLGTTAPAYLADHRVNEEPVCPASAYIVLAHAAAAEAVPGRDFELRDILVQQPLVFADDAPRVVHTILEKSENGEYGFRICSLEDEAGNAWKTHATGRIVAAAAPVMPVPPEVSEGIPEDPHTHYDRFDARGLSFGPAFRCIDRFIVDGGSAQADLQLTDGDEPSATGIIHPVLLDGAFHALWAAMPRELVADVAYLPFSIERVRFFRRAGSHVRAEARRRPRIPAGGETLTGDLVLLDDQRSLIADIQGFTLKRMSAAQADAGRRRAIRSWFYEPIWVAEPAPQVTDAAVNGAWIVVGAGDEARIAAQSLSAAGATCTTIAPTPQCGAEIASVLQKVAPARVAGIVFSGRSQAAASALDLVAAQANNCAMVASIVQACVASSNPPLPALWIVTNGGQHIVESATAPASELSADQTPLWGLARSLRLELPELRCTTIDLDPAVSVQGQIALLLCELTSGRGEVEVAFRAGARMVRRLRRATLGTDDTAESRPSGATQLRIPVRGVLENLEIQPATRRAPGPGEIEIEVKAAALNFRDVLNALGMYPGDAGALGSECAGTVVAVGDGVHDLAPGDDVMAVGEGTLGSHVTTAALLATRKPQGIGYAEAAGLPIAFLTVHEALIACADLKAGERVLIHAAAGGVGLAAVHVALALGAEVFATAGSDQKREFLKALGVHHVMSSRTLDFAQHIMEETSGAGVDVVLNSLNGEFIERGLAVMAQNGRFVELGKIGIWTPEQVARFRPDIDYSVLYLGDYFVSDPARIRHGLDAIAEKITAGELHPLPVTTYTLPEASTAFRYMAQAQHIGKVVLTPARRSSSALRAEATYLLTGGAGALGLAVAEWMIRHGARHLVLASRSEPTEGQRRRIARLARGGAKVTTVRCDVSRTDDVVGVVHDIRTGGLALRGIIHCAGVLDDGVVLQQTRERFAKVLAPKCAGAWNLAQASAAMPLDFLVFFSSTSSLLGSAGQSNYSAANAFMDTFARQLRARDVPAVSISWGIWADAGMAAALGDRNSQRWAEQGLTPMAAADAVVALEMALTAGIPHVGVLSIDWSRYMSAPANDSLRAFVGGLLEESRPAQQPAAKAPNVSERLRRIPAGQRRAAVLQHVRERAIKVLGLAPSFPLDARQGLRDVGLDSLLAIELRNTLQSDAQAPLPATLAFDYPNVEALTAFLCEGPFASLVGESQGAASAASSAAQTVVDLSDEQAEALLLAELAGFRTSQGN